MRWHYTTGAHMAEIVRDGFLEPWTPVQPPEKGIVFFTERDSYEPTATKRGWKNGVPYEMTIEEMERELNGLYRIGVADSYPLHPWIKINRLAHVPDRDRREMERTAREKGSDPFKFWGTLKRVPIADWAALEKYEDGQWIRCPSAEGEEARRDLGEVEHEQG